MIVPTSRLIFWVGAIFLPFAGLATAFPPAALLSLGLISGLSILALVDALLAAGSLKGIRVELPPVVRISKGRESNIELHIKNEGSKLKALRIGLAFPLAVHSPNRDLMAPLTAGSFSSTLKWPIKGLKQGRYRLDKCCLEAGSPAGFWAMRSSTPASVEIRIYPDLHSEQKHLAALFTGRRFGVHSLRQVGKGKDFEQLREYTPGDSFEDIHWKATAKWGRPITKVFQIERTQQVYVIIDASRLSARYAGRSGDHGPMKETGKDFVLSTIMERFVTASLTMALAAERQGDLFGVLTFSDRILSFVRAKNGKLHYDTCRDALYTAEPQTVAPDFEEVFTFIGNRIRRRALLVFLTSLDDPLISETFTRHIELISRNHLILVSMVRPFQAKPLFSCSKVETIDHIYRELGGHLLWESIRETGKILRHKGVGFHLLDNETMSAQLVSLYLNMKQRQVL